VLTVEHFLSSGGNGLFFDIGGRWGGARNELEVMKVLFLFVCFLNLFSSRYVNN